MTKKKINSLNNPYFLYKDKDHFEKEFKNAKELLAKSTSGTKIKNDVARGIKPAFSYSYIKIDQKIYALSHQKIYHKDTCDVKAGIDEEGFLYAIKIEKNRISNNIESIISIDIGLQEGLRALRNTPKGYKRYAAQNFQGSLTLLEYFEKTYKNPHTLKERLIERLTIARNLCAEVDAIHTGKTSMSGRSYVHGDIKPENIIISTNDKTINLIDFGTAAPIRATSSFETLAGRTLPYLPYDNYGKKSDGEARKNILKNMNLMDAKSLDIFALIRTLFFPRHSQFSEHDHRGVFTQEIYDKLPITIQSLLETHFEGDEQEREEIFSKKFRNITEEHYSAKFFAAIFAHLLKAVEYDKFPLKLNEEFLKALQNDSTKQDELLGDCPKPLPNKIDKNRYADFNPINYAIKNNSAEEINALIRAGYDQNQPKSNSNSMLIEAIQNNKIDAALALISAQGTDLNYQNETGRTAFAYAVYGEHLTILNKLCEKGARLDLADITGITPMHLAFLEHKTNTIPILINYNIELTNSVLTSLYPKENIVKESERLSPQMRVAFSFFKTNISYPQLFLFPQVHLQKEKTKRETINNQIEQRNKAPTI